MIGYTIRMMYNIAKHLQGDHVMTNAGNIFENICDKSVKIIIFLITGILTYWAARYSYFYPADYAKEHLLIAPDSIIKNLLALGIVLLITYGLKSIILRGPEYKQRQKVRIFAIAAVVITGALLIYFVSQTHIPPHWDQAQVYADSLNFMAGEYGSMKTYLGMYPQQYGLIFLYETIFRILPDTYIVLEYFNVIFVLCIIFFSYLLSEELFHNQTVNFYCILCSTLFLPMHIYVNFVYGDLASSALSVIGIWALLKWYHTGYFRYPATAVPAFCLAYLSRKNVLIILIAVLLTLLIDAFKRRNWKSLVLGVAILLIPMVCVEGVKYSYEVRSGQEISEGIPSTLWIAMGMQQSTNGSGAFNGFTESIYQGAAYGDTELASEFAVTYIENRLAEFIDDPDMAIDFYKAKIQGQWIEPTFSSLLMTSKFGDNPTEFTTNFYFGKAAEWVISVSNYYNFIMYISVLVFALTSLSRKDSILLSTSLIAVIGGFLFSILWEAKGRYVMPYIILLFPYMAYGIYTTQDLIMKGITKIKR